MALLMLFAFVAGAGTALSPCVLPILPAVLSAGVTGGRRRPLGVVTGLALSFTFATVALVYVIDALGLPDDTGDRRARDLRDLVVGAADRRPHRGLRVPHRSWPGPLSRRRVRLGPGGGRQPRPGLRALRRPDPGRRDHGLRGPGFHGGAAGGGAGLRGRLRRCALRAAAGRAQALRPARPSPRPMSLPRLDGTRPARTATSPIGGSTSWIAAAFGAPR